MTFGSLFAGIGGFDLGFERAGMTCKWQVEIDRNCRQILESRWNADCFEDVRSVGTTELVRVDGICGGFPCQDLSVAGRRAGLAGTRSGLWWEFRRVLAELSPAWVCIENVPGLLSNNGGRDFAAVLRSLAELGYGFAYRIFDAQWFKLAQRRSRVIIVGCLGNWRRAAEILFERESLPWNSPPSREEAARVAASLTSGVSASSGINRPGRRREDDVNIVCSLDSHMGSGGVDDNAAQAGHLIAHCLRGEGFDASEDGTGRGVPLVASPITAGMAKGSGVNDGPKGSPQNLIASRRHVRRLTPLECERLQGFPDRWTEGFSDSARYRMIGNAFPPQMSEWVGRRIMRSVASHE